MTPSTRHTLYRWIVLPLVLAGCRSPDAKPPEMAEPAPEPAPAQASGVPLTNDSAVAATTTAADASSTGLPAAGLTQSPSAAPPPPPESSLREHAPLRDEQIVAVVAVVNDAKIEQAKIARQKSKDARIRKLAEMATADHGQAKRELAKLSGKLGDKPLESPLSTEVSADASATLETLKKAHAKDFDRTYIDAHVRAHQKLLDLFGRELIPGAKNIDLKRTLQELRRRAQLHLDEALALQQSLGVSGSGSK